MVRETSKIYTPELIEELEEVFHDAHDQLMQQRKTIQLNGDQVAAMMIEEEKNETLSR